MSAEEPTPKHPFEQARETWDAWSMADTMRAALHKAREQGDYKSLAEFERYPGWTQGPGPVEALRANRTQVDLRTGWRWLAVRHAREQGHAWAEIGTALGVGADRACHDYLDAVGRQHALAERDPELGRLLRYDPAWTELAQPNAADHAHQRDQQDREAGRDR
jgi:hypothetical protein